MDEIIAAFVEAGYYRARITSLSEFDKIIGGMAWALQVFSYGVNIDVFFTDTLDLGRKIALTERIVMLLIALKCPYRIEPHQIVGLDYTNLLPCIQWLLKRSEEVRLEHEAFNRLLALRHYHRITNTEDIFSRSNWSYTVPISILQQISSNPSGSSMSADDSVRTNDLIDGLHDKFTGTKVVSFIQLPSHFRAANVSSNQKVQNDYLFQVQNIEDNIEDDEPEELVDVSKGAGEYHDYDESDSHIHKELDDELLATNQKILNILKRLDSMPNDLEINQYQRRYIELHQQLISKNKDVKKLFDLFNCLESTKHYLLKEINLLDSIATNLDLTTNSLANRSSFMQQFQDIIAKIETVRQDNQERRDVLRERCEKLNLEYASIVDQS